MEPENESGSRGSAPGSPSRLRRQLHPASSVFGAIEGRDRTPRRSDGEEPQQPAPADSSKPLQEIVDNELGKYLPPTIVKCVKKQCSDLLLRIKQLQKTNDRRVTLQQDIDVLRSGYLPKGVRSVPHAFETHLLDSEVDQEGISGTVDIGSSIRACKEKFYLQHVLAQKELDLQLMNLHRANLRDFLKKSSFVERCMEPFEGVTSGSTTTSAAVLDLEDDEVDEVNLSCAGISKEKFKAHLLSLYKKILDREAARKANETESRSKSLKAQEDMIKKIAARSPEDFLNEAIDKRLAASKSSRPKQTQNNNDVNASGLVVAALSSSSGKVAESDIPRFLPSSSQQQSSQALKVPKPPKPPKPPKGQFKGKGKGVGSKGKGTPNFAGDKGFKGKGKGKGRGKFSFSFSSPKNGSSPLQKGGKSKGKGKMTNKGTFPGGKGSTKGWQAGYNPRRWQ